MKRILGLDIGTTSIGWAVVEATSDKPEKYSKYFNDDSPETKTDTNNQRTGILKGEDGLPAVGVRIISQEGKMLTRFEEGKKLNEKKNETPTAQRRRIRGGRKLKSRYKLRRDKLCSVLEILGMLPDASYKKITNRNNKEIWKAIEKEDIKNSNGKWYTKKREYEEIGNKKKNRTNEEGIITGIGEDLYKLRSNASINPLKDKKDWGRVLFHLNQWRGYSSDRYSSNEEDEQSDDGYYTNLVVDVIEIDRKFKDKLNKRVDKIYYQIKFENGDVGIDIVKVGENSFYSKFRKDEVSTYKKAEDENDKSVVYITWQNLKKEAWAYRKWQINNNIETYVNNKKGTVGSYFFNSFFNEEFIRNIPIENRLKRIRHNVVNRGWYEQEFETIWKIQFQNHKEYFTSDLIEACIDAAFTKDKSVKKELEKIKDPELRLKTLIKDKIIYYQRPWQQAKNKGECRYEKIPDIQKDKSGKVKPHADGKLHYKGRTVIPRSHPLHQEYKIWQQINNVKIWFYPTDKREIDLMEDSKLCLEKLKKTPIEIKELLYERLQERKEQSWRTFVNETFNLDVKVKKEGERNVPTENEYYSVNYIKKTKKGDEQDNLLKGNKTKKQIAEILKPESDAWFSEIAKSGIDKHTPDNINKDGKIISSLNYKTKSYTVSNLQLLWECIYDLTGYQAGKNKENIEMIKGRIRNHFSTDIVSDVQCSLLAEITLEDAGMGQLSARAINKLLPLMVIGKLTSKYPQSEKVKEQIQDLIELNQIEQNEINDDLKLYSLRDFITDKKARIKLSEKMSADEFRGLNYSEATAVVYGNHSKAGITNVPAEEIKERINNLQPVLPGKMNNPIVEKIVNETIKLVQLIYQTYGFDEVRIELSRDLKNSREDREAIWDAMNKNNKRNEWAKQMLREMFNEEETSSMDISFSSSNIDKIKIIEDVVAIRKGKEHEEKRKKVIAEPTKADIIKYKCWLEQQFRCPYTDTIIPFSDVFSKHDKVQIEHIIPRQRYPDNSYSNKVITWAEVNSEKSFRGNRTAYEFIVSKRDNDDTITIEGKEEKVKLIAANEWEEKVNEMFKGRKAKNLLRPNIPEDPINRELKDTQYINKKLREKIGEAIGIDKVWTTTGQITDMLRNAWHLNDKVMKELVKERYEKFQVNFGSGSTPLETSVIFKTPEKNNNSGEEKLEDKYPNFSKRLDHRHHALDAIIIACTKQQHIQLINTLNTQFESIEYKGEDEKEIAKKRKYKALQNLIYELITDEGGKRRKKYFTPWEADKFIPEVKDALSKIIIAHKNSNVLTSQSKNKQIDKDNYTSISIRQGLHKETLIGKRKLYNKELTPILEIIDKIFAEKRISDKSYTVIIISIVFKEKFQKLLISLFDKFSSTNEIAKLKTIITDEINSNKNDYFEGASTFDLVPIKRDTKGINEIKKLDKIIDFRTRRYLTYKNELVDNILRELNSKPADERKKELEKKKKQYFESPLYYNALYDVRMNESFCKRMKTQFEGWLPLFEFKIQMLDEIEYVKYDNGKWVVNQARTEQIKNEIKKYKFDFTPENILIEHPIKIGENWIEIKKATVRNTAGNNQTKKILYDENGNEIKDDVLVEIRPKTFVVLESKFRAFITEDVDNEERKVDFIEFKEALEYKKLEIDFIKAEIKIPNKKIPNNHKLLFTLSKNDLVVIPENKEDVIDWKDVPSYSNRLYRVLDFDSTGVIRFVKHTIADSIKLKDKIDAEGLRIKAEELNENLQKEKADYNDEQKRIEEFLSELEKMEEGLAIEIEDYKIKGIKLDLLTKEHLRLQKEIIQKKRSEIKIKNKELKSHLPFIVNLETELTNLSKAISFNSKTDKTGKIKESKPIEEPIERKFKEDIKKIIKVFTDKLGKKVVPYWEFPNGCWDKAKAIELGLINTKAND